jgi:hypothetical protein
MATAPTPVGEYHQALGVFGNGEMSGEANGLNGHDDLIVPHPTLFRRFSD